MNKLIEVFAIEVGSAVNGEMKTAWTSQDGYPSKETIELVLAAHRAKFASVKKLYKLEEAK